LHGGFKDLSGLSGFALGGLVQDLHSGIGKQGLVTADRFEAMLNHLVEALAIADRRLFESDLDAAGQRGVGGLNSRCG